MVIKTAVWPDLGARCAAAGAQGQWPDVELVWHLGSTRAACL